MVQAQVRAEVSGCPPGPQDPSPQVAGAVGMALSLWILVPLCWTLASFFSTSGNSLST